MTDELPDLDTLIDRVRTIDPANTELARVRDAVGVADELGELGDHLVGHFVDEARTAGETWTAIGGQLGLTRQGAQKRYQSRPEAGRGGLFSLLDAETTRAVANAREEARRRQSDTIGVEHLVLAIVGEPDSAGARALSACGAEPAAVVAAIDGRFGRPSGTPAAGDPPFTPHAKAVLERSLREALRLGSRDITTAHLAAAALSGPDGPAQQVLRNLGVTHEALRQAIGRQ